MNKASERRPLEATANLVYERPARDWPVAPKGRIRVELDAEHALLAQHLWMNGAEIKAIAARLKTTPSMVQAYLSCRTAYVFKPLTIDPSLKSTLLAVLPEDRSYRVSVIISMQASSDACIDGNLLSADGRFDLASLRYFRHFSHISGSPPELVLTLEELDRAAGAWVDAMRPRMRGLHVDVTAVCLPADKRADRTKRKLRPPQLGSLKAPLLDLLDQTWKKPRGEFGEYEKRLAVTVSNSPVVRFQSRRTEEPRELRGRRAERVIELARAIHQRAEESLSGALWTVYVTGDMLESSLERDCSIEHLD